MSDVVNDPALVAPNLSLDEPVGRDKATLKQKTRIQATNEAKILEAALDVFSKDGFRGATLDKIKGLSLGNYIPRNHINLWILSLH